MIVYELRRWDWPCLDHCPMQEEPTLEALNTLIEEGDNIKVDHMKDVLQLVKPAKKAKAAPKKKNDEPLVVPVWNQ